MESDARDQQNNATPTRPHRLHTPPLRSRLLPALVTTGALLELCWATWLGLHLPVQYVSTNWNVAWAGLDVAEVLALLATAWAAWHERVELVLFAGLAATLILADAWFDVTTNHSGGVNSSVLFLTIEAPVAVALYWICIRTFRKLKRAAMSDATHPPEPPFP